MKIHGKCLCGEISITISNVSQNMTVCHCSMCQQFHGGPMIALGGVSANQLNIVGQENLQYYASSDWAQRVSCKNCGSSMAYFSNDDEKYYFSTGLFEQLPDFFVDIEMAIENRASYLSPIEGAQQMTMSEYVEHLF